MYSNNIVNFQESTTILNACIKKIWKLIEYTRYVHIYIFVLLFQYTNNSELVYWFPVKVGGEGEGERILTSEKM